MVSLHRSALQGVLLTAISFVCALPAVAAPVAGGVVNAASSIVPGRPNGNLTPGGMFSLFGSAMGPAQLVEVDAFPLPTELAGTSVSVTIGEVSVECIMIFSSAGQLAAILPSATPLGAGVMTVTYLGETSPPLAIVVAAGNFGIFALNQRGAGPGVFSDPLSSQLRVNGFFEAAKPGEIWDVWGTGLGPVDADEAAGPAPGDLSQIEVRVLVGGVESEVLYRGRSGCCAGVDQVRFIVPEGVSSCYTPVVVVVEGVPSNFVSMAVDPGGATCSEAGLTSAENLEQFRATGFLRQAQVLLARIWTTTQLADGAPMTQRSDSATASFVEFTLDNILNLPPEASNLGSCLVSPMPPFVPGVRGLDAGPLTLATPTALFDMPVNGPGFYTRVFAPPAATLEAGDYTFATPGGEQIGPFSTSITLPEPIELLNPEDLAVIDRAAGVRILWRGGAPAPAGGGRRFVQVSGFSPFELGAQGLRGAQFVCYADVEAGELELPQEVLYSLPASIEVAGAPGGSITFGQTVFENFFVAQGADVGQFIFSDLYTTNTTFE